MIILLSKYNHYTGTTADIQHSIDPDSITYHNTSRERVLLPYVLDSTTQTALKPLILAFAINGNGNMTRAAFTGQISEDSCDYKNVINRIDFYLSVNIQPRRLYIGLYVRIKPMQGRTRTYHIVCETEPDEIRAVVERYIASGQPISSTWNEYLRTVKTA